MVLPFSFQGKKISEKQYLRLLSKGCTVNMKGFKTASGTVQGLVRFNDAFELVLEEQKAAAKAKKKSASIACPACKKGTVIKGKTAYGCSHYKEGCTFRFTFDAVREKAKNQPLTAELVKGILQEGVEQ